MKSYVKILSLASVFVLAACSKQVPVASQNVAPQTNVTTQTVTYMCGAKHNHPMHVTYQFAGNDAVKADVQFAGKTYANLVHVKDINDTTKFENAQKWVWLVDGINAQNVTKKDGMMLLQHTAQADKILINYCDVKK
ncbi:hypothetical protein A6A19_05010 [Actinobacillus delphinicola]|uniref:hypothetical protein n=1 Tax=Actinobacillus delphinicola TaxID=51161 RepID=UPI0024422B29|nr:hypothetical protein [Actinobacillus delphinicola]MDG6897363.1 hypothetical protein [Actinobacillus delphinicola]